MGHLESYLQNLKRFSDSDRSHDILLAEEQARNIDELEEMAADFESSSEVQSSAEFWGYKLALKFQGARGHALDNLFIYHGLLFAVLSQDTSLFDYLYFVQKKFVLDVYDLSAKNFFWFSGAYALARARSDGACQQEEIKQYDYLGFICFHGADKLLSHVLNKVKFEYYWDSELVVKTLCAASAGLFYRTQGIRAPDVFHPTQEESVRRFLIKAPLIQQDLTLQQLAFACQQYLGSKSLLKDQESQMFHQEPILQLVQQHILLLTPNPLTISLELERQAIRWPLSLLSQSALKERRTSVSEPPKPQGRVRALK